MKKIFILFFMIISSLVYAAKDLSKLNTLRFNTEEKQVINGKEKTLKYNISIEFPNKIKKEMFFPEMNKGELYVYDGENKQVYLPIFDELKETKVDSEENKIIRTINKIRDLKDPKLKQEYQNKKLKNLYIDDDKKILINIKEYIEIADYILPKIIEIKDENISLGTVSIKDIEINPVFDKDEFKINKGKK